MRGTWDRRSLLANRSPAVSPHSYPVPPGSDHLGGGGMPFFQESWQEPFCATAPAPHPAADPPQLTPEAICLDFANNNQSRAPNGSGRQLRLNNRALCPADIVQCRGRIKAWDALGTPSTELASKPRTSPPPGVFMVQRDLLQPLEPCL